MQKMIGKMARMYPMLIAMGFMIVIIAFIIGYLNSLSAADYFAVDKVARETTLMDTRATIESTGTWLPYFKFLGVGIILGGIVMALRVIIDKLKNVGVEVLSNLPEEKRPPMPTPPWYGPLMPMVMMLGIVIFVWALVVSIQTAQLGAAVFASPLPVIDAAGAGSSLLADLQAYISTKAWLVPFKFWGVSTEFLAIAMGLATIINILTNQTKMLEAGISAGRS